MCCDKNLDKAGVEFQPPFFFEGTVSIIVDFCFQTYFLPVIGLVDPEKLNPGDLVVSNCLAYCMQRTCVYRCKVNATSE